MKDLKLKLKQLFEEKGELVVLIGAAVLGSLMLITSLFWPGSGFLSSSASGNALVLNEQVKKVQEKMTSPSNKPSGADMPAPEKLKLENLPKLLMFYVPDPNKYMVASLFDVPLLSDGQRRQPRILKPTEGLAASSLERTKVYMIRTDENGGNPEIFVLKDAPPKQSINAANNLRQQMAAGGRGGKGGSGGMMGSMPQMGGRGGLNQMTMAGDTGPKAHTGVYMPLTSLTGSEKLASQSLPLKLALITFAYPYRAQLDEFRSKLHLPSYDAVEKELSMAKTPDGRPLPNFRFLGVKVERREVDLLGNPLNGPQGSWVELDFDRDYKPYLIRSGWETQPDDPMVQTLTLEGAMMPRPVLLDKQDHYPDLETKLPSIKKEIDSLKANNDNQPRPLPSQFSDNGTSIFSSGRSNTNNPAMDPNNPMQPRPTGPGGRPGGGKKPGLVPPTIGGSPKPPAGQAAEPTEPLPSEFLLGRIIDVTVEPGKIYQYRLRVVLANPNYKRDDVANPTFAEKPELDPSDTEDPWYVVPQVVQVPADWKYYVGDFTTKETTTFQRPVPLKPNEVPFQIHRWVEWQDDKPGSGHRPIGDWAIAEKVIVSVGQYIGRPLHVELPMWDETRDAFIIPADHARGERGQPLVGVNVNFAHSQNESVLVDIEGPDLATYQRGTTRIKDDVDTEAIVLSHEGKLVVYNSERDKNDKERIQRVAHWKNHVKATKDQASSSGSATSKPFGGSGSK